MTITEFTARLIIKHPEAEVRRTERGLAINFTPNGKVYQFYGTHEAIAEQMHLVEVWYVEDQYHQVVGKAHSIDAVNELCIKRQDEEDELAVKWGCEPRIFTVRRLF